LWENKELRSLLGQKGIGLAGYAKLTTKRLGVNDGLGVVQARGGSKNSKDRIKKKRTQSHKKISGVISVVPCQNPASKEGHAPTKRKNRGNWVPFREKKKKKKQPR